LGSYVIFWYFTQSGNAIGHRSQHGTGIITVSDRALDNNNVILSGIQGALGTKNGVVIKMCFSKTISKA